MKKVIGMFAVVVMAAGFTSCEKCGQCNVTTVATSTTVDGVEQCAKGAAYDDLKTACDAAEVSGVITTAWVEN